MYADVQLRTRVHHAGEHELGLPLAFVIDFVLSLDPPFLTLLEVWRHFCGCGIFHDAYLECSSLLLENIPTKLFLTIGFRIIIENRFKRKIEITASVHLPAAARLPTLYYRWMHLASLRADFEMDLLLICTFVLLKIFGIVPYEVFCLVLLKSQCRE